MGKGGFQTLHNILDTDSIVGNILFRFENPMDFFYINWRPIIINPYRNFAILQDRSVDMDPAVSLQTVKNSVFYKRLKQKPRAFCLQHWSRRGPAGPVGPVGPVGPGSPCGPVVPAAPEAPGIPWGPVAPAGPWMPGGPTGPWGPVGPVGPCIPIGPLSVPGQPVHRWFGAGFCPQGQPR